MTDIETLRSLDQHRDVGGWRLSFELRGVVDDGAAFGLLTDECVPKDMKTRTVVKDASMKDDNSRCF